MRLTIKSHYPFLLTLAVSCLLSWQPVMAGDVEAIRPADSLPQTTPWDLEALSSPPEFEWGEGTEVRTLHYQGEDYQGKPTRVFAYYATPGSLAKDPSKDKNLPALVLVHGGGGKAFREWAELWARRGYAAIAMNLGGGEPDGGPTQTDRCKFGAIAGPVTDQWTYHAVANVIRAHSLLRSFPEVDPQRTAMTGISWGGYLTCIVAGLDNRFKAAVPVYGCGFLHENSVWLPQFAKMSAEDKAKWVRLWDPSQYVGSAAMPMLFVNGGNDGAYPPDSHAKTYALVQTPKNLRFSPELPHGHIFDRPKAIEIFIDHHLKNGTRLSKITSLDIGEKSVTARVSTETKLVSGQLHYTTDALPGDCKTRKWHGLPATIDQDRVTVERPPKDTVIWFLTVTDERDTMVSSRLIFPAQADEKRHAQSSP